jgi:O-antigen/teichoic acid export membrane protein
VDGTRVDHAPEAPAELAHGVALAHGAFFNTLAFLASNLRGIFTLLVAHLLGRGVLGTFGVAWATTDLVSKISTFGFETTAITFVAREEAGADRAGGLRVMRAALGIGVGLSVATAGLAWLLRRPLAAAVGWNPALTTATLVLLCSLPGVALYRISNAVSRGMAIMHHDIYSRGLTESLVTAAALLAAMALGARDLAPEFAVIAGTLASGSVAFELARRRFRGVRAHEGTMPFGRLVRDSGAVAAHDFLNIGIMSIDVIMLGLFVGRAPGVTLESVGVYAAAVEAAGGLRKVNQAFNPIFATTIARQMAAGHIRRAEATFGTLARWMLAVLLPAVAVFAVGGRVVMAIFGTSFVQGATWLAIVALACALNAFVGLGETILVVEKPRANLVNAFIALVVTIGANLLLIPRFGPLGAALGMLIPYSLYGLLRIVEIRWLFGWRWPWRALGRPLAAAIVPLALAVPARLVSRGLATDAIAAAVYAAAYVAAWRLIGLEAADRDLLQHLRARWRSA